MTKPTFQDARIDTASARDSMASSVRPAVWLLEDSPLEAQAVRATLAPRCDVVAFADGATLLERLDAADAPDALVLDWTLPGLSGLEVLEHVRATRDALTLPVLILTGSRASEPHLLEALAAGANDFVAKPYAPAELRARVTTLVHVRALHDRVRQLEAASHARTTLEQQLIGIVSHDLRNPLNVILGSSQLLLRSDVVSEPATKGVVRIQNAAERAARMVRDLLDFTKARLGGGLEIAPRAADLHAIVRAVVEDVAVTAPDRAIDVRLEGDGAGTWDPDRLGQVVQNLVTNALAYSPDGSPVEIIARSESDAVLLAVHNHGAPIAPAKLPTLFEPFTRAAAPFDATARSVGLGLYIVRQIVDAHGGAVAVRSSVDEGTTFTVRLPRAARR